VEASCGEDAKENYSNVRNVGSQRRKEKYWVGERSKGKRKRKKGRGGGSYNIVPQLDPRTDSELGKQQREPERHQSREEMSCRQEAQSGTITSMSSNRVVRRWVRGKDGGRERDGENNEELAHGSDLGSGGGGACQREVVVEGGMVISLSDEKREERGKRAGSVEK